jgi:hypothetical protein
VRANRFWAGVLSELPDFEDFVMRGPDMFERLRTPQVHYLTADGRQVDFIGRTESLEDDLAQVFSRLGRATPPLPHENVGSSGDYRTHYTPAMRRRVAEVFADDIDAFGYEF